MDPDKLATGSLHHSDDDQPSHSLPNKSFIESLLQHRMDDRPSSSHVDKPWHRLPNKSSIESLLQDLTDDRLSSSHVVEVERGTRIEVKRLDKIRNPENHSWELYDTVLDVTNHQKRPIEGRYSKYADYAFIVRRKVLPPKGPDEIPTYVTKIIVWSPWLRSVLKNALKDVRSVSRTANNQPLKLDAQTLLAFLPRLKDMICPDNSPNIESDETRDTAQHLQLLISYLESDHSIILQKIQNLLSQHEITWDLLWAIFLPGSTVLATCPVTSEKRAYKLCNIRKVREPLFGPESWKVDCEYIETFKYSDSDEKTFGWASHSMELKYFEGKKKIDELSAYPIQYDAELERVQDFLVCRGQKWASIPELHHMQVGGLVYAEDRSIFSDSTKYNARNVQGRIMVDRATFASVCQVPKVSRTITVFPNDPNSGGTQSGNYDNLLYASPIVYGFDLSDKRWVRFNIQDLSEIRWNDNILKNLTIDQNTKAILQGLIESHAQDRPFDDFVEGKGLGLVVNLFGPPGVGKTLTVEAISEHLRRPLYAIGAGDLGNDASSVNEALKKTLSLIPKWNAILLIDEADVFLEQRGTYDLKRNATVAVFLREIENFRGILFLTTNRAKEFDHAFQSRIHLSLRYKDLDPQTRTQLWSAFLEKARDNPSGSDEISSEQMSHLAQQDLNGRQIKNVVKVAASLARFKQVPLGYDHIIQTLNLGESPVDSDRRKQGNEHRRLNDNFKPFLRGVVQMLPLLIAWIVSLQ